MKKSISITDHFCGDVTTAAAETLRRVNPYYTLVSGKPLPLVVGEKSQEGTDWRNHD